MDHTRYTICTIRWTIQVYFVYFLHTMYIYVMYIDPPGSLGPGIMYYMHYMMNYKSYTLYIRICIHVAQNVHWPTRHPWTRHDVLTICIIWRTIHPIHCIYVYVYILCIDPTGTREPGTQLASEPQHALPSMFPLQMKTPNVNIQRASIKCSNLPIWWVCFLCKWRHQM